MFDGSIDFTTEIQKRIKSKDSSYLDAVMDVCEAFEIEPQSLAKYLTKTMIERIRIEASEKHLIRSKNKEKRSKLPL